MVYSLHYSKSLYFYLLHGKSYLRFQIKTRGVHSFDFEIMHMILDQTALSSILPLYMCLSFLLSISHSLTRSLSQYVIKGCKGTELELSLRAVCNTCYG